MLHNILSKNEIKLNYTKLNKKENNSCEIVCKTEHTDAPIFQIINY